MPTQRRCRVNPDPLLSGRRARSQRELARTLPYDKKVVRKVVVDERLAGGWPKMARVVCGHQRVVGMRPSLLSTTTSIQHLHTTPNNIIHTRPIAMPMFWMMWQLLLLLLCAQPPATGLHAAAAAGPEMMRMIRHGVRTNGPSRGRRVLTPTTQNALLSCLGLYY
jgi:hypothetical protein